MICKSVNNGFVIQFKAKRIKYLVMRRITVFANQIALITKRARLIGVETEGRYWIACTKRVQFINVLTPITLDDTWEMYLESGHLDFEMKIISVRDNELGIEMKNGLFSRVLSPGKYLYWNSPVTYDVLTIDMTNPTIEEDIPTYLLKKVELRPYVKCCEINSWEKGILTVNGKFEKMLDPGLHQFWNVEQNVNIQIVDTRIQTMPIAGQEILTKDKVGIRVNFSVQYQVVNVYQALNEVKDYATQLYTKIQLLLREYIGKMTLDQLLTKKEDIGSYILSETNDTTEVLGVELISGGIKDIILPGDVKDIMNQVLIAQKKAQANLVMRQEETASTRSLLNTAKLMEDNAMLLKLKEMEYMEKIADKIGEITVNGGSQVMDQIREIVISK